MKKILINLLIIICTILGILSYSKGSSELIRYNDGSLARVMKVTDKYKIKISYNNRKDSIIYITRSRCINSCDVYGTYRVDTINNKQFENLKIGSTFYIKLNHSIAFLEMRIEYVQFIVSMILIIVGLSKILIRSYIKSDSIILILFGVSFLILIIL